MQPDGCAAVRGVPHHAIAGIDAYVAGRVAEEDQVTGLRVRHRCRGGLLRLRRAGQADADPREDILRKARAVEAGRRGPAVDVVDAGQAGSDAENASRTWGCGWCLLLRRA